MPSEKDIEEDSDPTEEEQLGESAKSFLKEVWSIQLPRLRSGRDDKYRHALMCQDDLREELLECTEGLSMLNVHLKEQVLSTLSLPEVHYLVTGYAHVDEVADIYGKLVRGLR